MILARCVSWRFADEKRRPVPALKNAPQFRWKITGWQPQHRQGISSSQRSASRLNRFETTIIAARTSANAAPSGTDCVPRMRKLCPKKEQRHQKMSMMALWVQIIERQTIPQPTRPFCSGAGRLKFLSLVPIIPQLRQHLRYLPRVRGSAR